MPAALLRAPNRDTFVSWQSIVAANPGAVIVGGFGVNQGSGNPALTTAVDNLSLGYGTGDAAVCVTYARPRASFVNGCGGRAFLQRDLCDL